MQVVYGRGSAFSSADRSLFSHDLHSQEAGPGHCSARLVEHESEGNAQTG